MTLVLSSDGIPIRSSDGVQIVPSGGAVPLSNTTPAGATVLGLSGPILFNVSYAPPGVTLWFVYRAITSSIVTFFAFGNTTYYVPITTVYTGTPDALLSYLGIQGESVPVRVPTVAGTSYYFGITTRGTPDQLTISLLQAPFVLAQQLAALTLDTAPGFRAELTSLADGSILNFIPFPAGQDIDILLGNGIILAEDTLVGGNTQLQLRSAAFQFVKAISRGDLSWPVNGERIRIVSDQVDHFYVATEGTGTNAILMASISSAGVIGGTTWIISGHGLSCIGVSPDAATMFYSHGGVAKVQRWTLGSNTAGADFANAVTGYNTSDLLVFPDGTVLVLYSNLGDAFARLYATDGSTVMDYAIGTTSAFSNQLVYTHDYASFLAVTSSRSAGIDSRLFTVVRLSDGVVLSTSSIPKFNSGAQSSPPMVA